MKYSLLFWIASVAAPALWPLPGYTQETSPLSISLQEGLRLALDRNETLQMAREDLQKSHQGIREALADGLPRIDLSLDYNRNWLLPSLIFDTPQGRQSFSVGTRNNLAGKLELRQPLYAGGKFWAGLQILRTRALSSQEEVRAVRQQVWASVEVTFYDLLLARDLVRVSRLGLERAKTNLRQVQKLRKGGRASDYDLLRAEVQVSERRPDSIRAENDLKLARINYKNAVGLDPERPIQPSGAFRQATALDPGRVEALVRLGLKSRPEIRQLNHRLEIGRQAVKRARAESRPTLDLLINGRLEAQSNRFNFNSDDVRKSWFSGLSVQFPLFDGFRTRSQVAQARSDLRRAELEAAQLQRNIHLHIVQAWLELQETRERETAQEQTVTLARRGLQISESRYASGVGTQLEVVDAQLALLRTEIDHARAQRDRSVALVNLERNVGTLGEQSDEQERDRP